MNRLPASLPASLRMLERGWLSSNSLLGFAADGTATLVDSGYVGHAAQTVALVGNALASRDTPQGGRYRLTRLINTHSHSDHIGGNAALQRAFGCRIIIPAGLEAHVTSWDEEALFLTPAAQSGDRFIHDEVLRPGDEFMLGGLAWQAYAAPGHDMEALIFHCPEARLLISGDALWEDGFGAVFAEILGTGPGLQRTEETLDLIASLDVAVVIPGHGPIFADVAEALARARQRLAAFRADPLRMARAALKGCFTFNLLDLQRLPLAELPDYLARVPFFREVGEHTLGMDPPTLAQWLLAELQRAGAVAVRDGDIVPTMAA